MRRGPKSSFYMTLLAFLALLLSTATLGCDDLGPAGSVDTSSVTPGTTGATPGETLPGVETSTLPTVTVTLPSDGPPVSVPTTAALSSAEERLPDGTIRAMGYIDDVWEDGEGRHLSIDYAEFLTGAEADAAAVAAGVIPPGEHVDNDYWISNVNPMLREFDISDSVAITTSTRWVEGESMGAPCTWEDFLSFWGPGPLQDGESHLSEMPWWIVRDGNTIISIDEQYLP